MKRFYQSSIAIIIIALMVVMPVFANSPWDENVDVTVSKDTSTNQETEIETAKVTTTENKTEEKEKEDTASSTVTIKGTITASELNVRSGPWGDILGTLKSNDQVDIIEACGDWYKISYNGKTGYIHGNWVTTQDKKGQTEPKYGVVSNCYWLNVRRTPSGDVLDQLQSGSQVYILGQVGDWYKIKYNGNEAYVHKNYIDSSDGSKSSEPKKENKSNDSSFTGYVNACALNVRSGPWGSIVGTLEKGEEVKVVGKEGDWYIIDYNGTKQYVSAKYIYNSKIAGDNGDNSSNYENATNAKDGTLQQRIVSCARDLVGSTNFRGADVNYGSKACAKVATTALKNAGALDKVYLNCRDSVKALKAKGWVEVTPPPYQEGDVITWKTYDYTGDGIKDDDTHIGIVVKEGNTYKVMNNSSKLKTPRISNINIAPISRVLRKV